MQKYFFHQQYFKFRQKKKKFSEYCKAKKLAEENVLNSTKIIII